MLRNQKSKLMRELDYQRKLINVGAGHIAEGISKLYMERLRDYEVAIDVEKNRQTIFA